MIKLIFTLSLALISSVGTAQSNKEKLLATECANAYGYSSYEKYEVKTRPNPANYPESGKSIARLDAAKFNDTYNPSADIVLVVGIKKLNRFNEAYIENVSCGWKLPSYEKVFGN